MQGGSFALLSGKAASTWSPQKLPPKSITSFCICFHQFMGKISLEGIGGEFALMLLTSTCCNMNRAIIAHPGAMRAIEYLILVVTGLLKGKAEFSAKTLTF